MKRRAPLCAILLGGLLLFSGVASAADSNNLTIAPSTCAVDEGDRLNYSVNGASLAFAAGKTGTVGVRCMVPNPIESLGIAAPGAMAPNPSWTQIALGCQDPDGYGPNYGAVVQLKRVRISDGAAFLVTELDCNAKTKPLSHTFDFWNYAYWINVGLQRLNTAQNPSVWAVKLW
jgi:hypothetical protein